MQIFTMSSNIVVEREVEALYHEHEIAREREMDAIFNRLEHNMS